METVLRPRRWLVALMALVAVLLAFTLAGALLAVRDGELHPVGALVVVTLSALMLALVLWGLWRVPGLRYVVTDHDIAVLIGRREQGRLRFADLTQVRAHRSGRRFARGWDHVVTLTGTTPDGRVGVLRLAGILVPSLRPVLEALAPVVAERPELLPDGPELFERFLVQAP